MTAYYLPSNSTLIIPTNSKDVRLPVQLQRAMAAEAEAAREARAKVSKTPITTKNSSSVQLQSENEKKLRH